MPGGGRLERPWSLVPAIMRRRCLMGPVEISVVIPVYNSAECLEELVCRLTREFSRLQRSHEIILVNDGSRDGSWVKILELGRDCTALRGINFRRNFGQDNALMAGLRAARGSVVIIMDDDPQHGPADRGKLVGKVEEGYDVCYARFPWLVQAWWKNLGSILNDRMANIVIGKPKEIYLSPYKAIAGSVAGEVAKYDGPFPYVDGLIFRVTSRVTQVEAQHHPRFAGRPNYNFIRSVAVWLRVTTGFSVFPLRIATFLGFACALVGLFLAAYFALHKIIYPGAPLGWASTIVTLLFLGGIQLASLGLVGEYLGRAYLHLNRQPQYVIREVIGGDEKQP